MIRIFGIIALWLGCAGLAWGQSAVSLARMNQDVRLLQEQVGQLRLQVENLQRQQAQLLDSFDTLLRRQDELTASLASANAQTATRLDALPAREQALRREVVAEVSKQIEALAQETQKAIDALAKAQSAAPRVSVSTTFDDSYPQTGIAHVVQSGETISGIARKYGSTIQDIMNANRIAKATALKAGETIFVPVKQD